MNDSSLIINLRNHLSWYQRAITDVSTAVMWGFWIYLWRPVAGLFHWIHGWGVTIRMSGLKALIAWPPTFEALFALIGACGTLLLWQRLPAQQPRSEDCDSSLQSCARHFDLPSESIENGRASSVSVVHHDSEGRIIGIETRH